MTATQALWTKQYDQLHAALAPHVITFTDGEQAIDLDAPTHLVRQYQGMQQVGYANGWM